MRGDESIASRRRRQREAPADAGRNALSPGSLPPPPTEFRGPLAASIADSSERIRLALLAHLRAARLSRRALAVLVRQAGYRLDVNRLLAGRSSLEISRFLALLDILGLHPRSFFSSIWSAPAAPSPLLDRLRELLAKHRRSGSPVTAPPDPSSDTPEAKTRSLCLLLLRLLAVRRTTRLDLRRQLAAEGVRIDVQRVLCGANRLHLEDLIAIVAALGLHPLEFVRIAWPPPASTAPTAVQRSRPATTSRPA